MFNRIFNRFDTSVSEPCTCARASCMSVMHDDKFYSTACVCDSINGDIEKLQTYLLKNTKKLQDIKPIRVKFM